MATKKDNEVTGWVGWVFFAGFMMIMMGALKAIWGITALFNSDWLVVGDEGLLLLDLTTWGWIQLILGLVILFAGFSVMSGAAWARVVGIVVAVTSIIGNMATVDIHPIWSIMVIVMGVVVVYALTVHGDEVKEVE